MHSFNFLPQSGLTRLVPVSFVSSPSFELNFRMKILWHRVSLKRSNAKCASKMFNVIVLERTLTMQTSGIHYSKRPCPDWKK